MSPLAFDKQGKPFAWHRRTRKLLVRMFRNPAARGTCCQVLDADGNPLYIDAETEYGEFRKAVGNVPGLYRLDQCDDDGVEIDEAQPAYVSIDLSRNASLAGDGGEVDPLVIIEHMFAIHADVMKTMAMQQASIMAASAEILRAPFRPAAPAVARDPRDEDDKDDKDDDDDEEDELEPDPWASWRPMLEMVEPHLPKLGAFLLAQFVAFMKKTARPPAAVPGSPPAPAPAADTAAAPSQGTEPASAAAGSSPSFGTSASSSASATSSESTPGTSTSSTVAAAPAEPPSARVDGPTSEGVAAAGGDTGTKKRSHTSAPSTPAATSAAATEPVAPTTTAVTAAMATTSTGTNTTSSSGAALAIVPATAPGAPRNAQPSPTPAQWQHLYEVREGLSPKERAIAENAITRMTPELLAQWLADLSALSVDDAVRMIRSMIAKLRPTRGTDGG